MNIRKLRLWVLINTSFNMHEEPIVNSIDDAFRAFVIKNWLLNCREEFLKIINMKLVSIVSSGKKMALGIWWTLKLVEYFKHRNKKIENVFITNNNDAKALVKKNHTL